MQICVAATVKRFEPNISHFGAVYSLNIQFVKGLKPKIYSDIQTALLIIE